MKNHLSLIFMTCILLLNSCSNQNQNQNVAVSQVDTGILIASNDQNLDLDTQPTQVEKEAEIATSTQTGVNQKNNEDQNLKKKIAIQNQKIKQQVVEKNVDKSPKNTVPENTKKIGEITKTEKEKESEIIKTEKKEEKPTPANPAFNHDQWDQLLRKYVSTTGKVNYKGIKSEKSKLETYLKNLEANPVQDNWSKEKKMAYWINAYNAFTIKMIIDNYPVSSITKLHGGKPWDVKWINLVGKTYNLNNIENDILRPKYKDSRIHFAVNCAAKSCPPILNQAWTESNLNQMLEKQTNAFINNPKFNTISANEVEISKIFEWYAVDFGNIIDYLNKYSTTKINKKAKVKYKEYDWALNE